MKPYLLPVLFTLLMSGLSLWVEQGAYTPSTLGIPTVQVADYPVGLLTLEERCVDEKNQQVICHQLTDIQEGDILITKSNHTLFYRHGHAGVVIDAKEGLVLEALGYGESSTLEPLEKWNYYPTVKVLRLKDASQRDRLMSQNFTPFLGIGYHLFARKADLSATHCADIVWKVFNQIGIDVDSNGGYFVTPKDIAKSPYFFEIASYGFETEGDWS